MTKLYYITIATKPHPVLDNIIKRAKKQNEEIIVLGKEENRHIGWNAKGNFGVKLREVQQFINREEINEDDIILFTDAYDVVYGGNLREVKERFENFRKPVVFGAETECNPKPELKEQYIQQKETFSYLNSGMFIGKAYALRQLMADYKYDDAHDDQLYWTTKFLKYENKIALDYRNELFLNTHGIDIEEIEWNRSYFTYKGRSPLFVHINGPNKNDLFKLL